MTSSYISISALQQSTMLTNVNLGVNVNSFPISSAIRYSFDTITIRNCSMTDLQSTQGTFTYTGINNILDYAKNNQIKVRFESLLSSLPTWFTSLSDPDTVLIALNTHISNVLTRLKTNYSNIIEYDLINDVFDNNGYKSNFLNNILSGSNLVSTVFCVAKNILGPTNRVKLLYNHSNAEEAYTNSNTIISILSNYKTDINRYPIDGISLNVNADSNISFLKVENSIINIRSLNYDTITLNSVNYSIPDYSSTNLDEQARFYKTLVEIGFNYSQINTISLSGFNDSDVVGRTNSVLFSNSIPKPAYHNIINLFKTYNPSWLNLIYNRTTNRDNSRDIDRLIVINNPVLTNYTPPVAPSGGSLNSISLINNLNVNIPNDFLGLSQTPYIIDSYNFKFRHSYSNLINIFKFTKKSNMGMRFRCFLTVNSDNTPQAIYSNKKMTERLNYSVSIGAKCAIQMGHGKITTSLNIPKSPPQICPPPPASAPAPARAPAVAMASYYDNLATSVYDTNINNYVKTASDIVNNLDTSVFETIEIFNEPELTIPEMDKYEINPDGVLYYRRVYKDIISRLNANPKISDNIVLGSYASTNYYNNPVGDPIIDLNWLIGKVKSVSFHYYPAAADDASTAKLCRENPADPTTCFAISPFNDLKYHPSCNRIIRNILNLPYLPSIPGYKFRRSPRTIIHLMESSDRISNGRAAAPLVTAVASWVPMIDDINNKIVKPTGSTDSYKYGFHLNETNNIANSGQFGLSDVFASALWVIDWSLHNASVNVRRMNLHTLESAPMPYNIIDYPDKYNLDVPFDSIINVRPIYYGYWFTHAAMRCDNSHNETTIINKYENTSRTLRVWQLRNSLETTFVVIYVNYAPAPAPAPGEAPAPAPGEAPAPAPGEEPAINSIVCSIPAPDQSNSTTGKVIRLLSRDGLYGTNGVTFGNLSLDGTTDGIPYNVKNSSVIPITLSEDGIDSALDYEDFSSTNSSGVWSFEIPIQSPSAFILRV